MTGNDLVQRWAAWIRQWVVLTEAESVVVALWCLHTWVSEHFSSTPYLSITASVKGAGKTTLLEVIKLLSRNAYQYATVKTAPMVRMIEAAEGRITVLIDEAEKLRQATLGDTRSMLATGYRRGAAHPVTVGKGVILFPTFCPKAFASIGDIQPILRDRSILLDLRRAKPERDLWAERTAAETEAGTLIQDWQNFSAVGLRLTMHTADWLSGRDREIWTPLVTMAHALAVHKATLDLLLGASVDLSNLKTLPLREYHSIADEAAQDDSDAAVRVLQDIATVILPNELVLPTDEALKRLQAIPTAPWRTWRGDGLNAISLAALLQRFQIEPKLVRPVKGKGASKHKPVRGYDVADIRKAAGKL